MTTTACFMIVSKNDIPIYEAEVGAPPRVSSFLSSLFSLTEALLSGNYRFHFYFFFLFMGKWWIEFNRLTWYGNFLLFSFFSNRKRRLRISTNLYYILRWILFRIKPGLPVLCEAFLSHNSHSESLHNYLLLFFIDQSAYWIFIWSLNMNAGF